MTQGEWEKIRLACITSPTEDAVILEEQAKGSAAWNSRAVSAGGCHSDSNQ